MFTGVCIFAYLKVRKLVSDDQGCFRQWLQRGLVSFRGHLGLGSASVALVQRLAPVAWGRLNRILGGVGTIFHLLQLPPDRIAFLASSGRPLPSPECARGRIQGLENVKPA